MFNFRVVPKKSFATTGFDSLIGEGTVFDGDLTVTGTTVVNGMLNGGAIKGADVTSTKKPNHLMVNGQVIAQHVTIDNLTICGTVQAAVIYVEGDLAVKSTAKLVANRITYRRLFIEPGAVVIGTLVNLDHANVTPQGEPA
jgi:cytoskeletal protein CcmA (bactofilin family)